MTQISNPHASVGRLKPPPGSMPAITIWQPWASMIAEGIKPIEFRSWCAPRRLWGRRIAIHAAARPVKTSEIRAILYDLDRNPDRNPLDVEAARPFLSAVLQAPASLRCSAVLCTAILGVPLSPDQIAAAYANDSDRDGHFSWGWPLSEIQRLEPPVPASGAQGWWNWTPPA